MSPNAFESATKNSEDKVLFPVEECELFSTKITQFDNLSIKVHSEKLMINGDVLSKGSHLKLVKKGVDFIKLNKAKKIVLSRKEVISYSKLDVLNTFKKMLSNYVNAFVYVWFHPSIGLWMGATPERLINLKEQNTNEENLIYCAIINLQCCIICTTK